MIFLHRTYCGKDFFYPLNEEALRFVNAFPSSSGKRKCLTKIQYELLKFLGIEVIVKPYLDVYVEDKFKDKENNQNEGSEHEHEGKRLHYR